MYNYIMQENNNNNNTSGDSSNEKIMCALAYILFFVPLIAIPNSSKGKFHANQGLNLLIVGLAGDVALSIIPILGWMLLPLWGLAVLVIGVIGVVNALNEKETPLPLVGNLFKIIK